MHCSLQVMELLQLCSSLITFLVLPSISLSRANAVKPFIFPASKTNLCKGGSPGLVVIGGDSCTEGCGFESQHWILDEPFSHLFVVKIVMFV